MIHFFSCDILHKHLNILILIQPMNKQLNTIKKLFKTNYLQKILKLTDFSLPIVFFDGILRLGTPGKGGC